MAPSKIIFFDSVLIAVFLFAALAAAVSAEITFFDQDDAFIMGDYTTGGTSAVSDGGTSGVTSDAECTYKWKSTNWSECLPSGKQTRNCTNVGTCSDIYKTPEAERACIYIAPQKIGEENKEPKNETEKQNETVETILKEIADENGGFLYLAIISMAGFIIICLKKGYFKRMLRRKQNADSETIYQA